MRKRSPKHSSTGLGPRTSSPSVRQPQADTRTDARTDARPHARTHARTQRRSSGPNASQRSIQSVYTWFACTRSTKFLGERAFSRPSRQHTIRAQVVTLLTKRLAFPSAEEANDDGLVAVGGDLSPERLLLAYRSGIFPWPVFEDDLMTWFSPNPRAILEFDAFRVSRSLQKVLRRGVFEVRFNSDFEGVIAGCAAPAPGRQGTWITDQLRAAYIELHRLGHAHSVESWFEGALVGGLYGVALGGFFSGESMFSRASDASKVALVHLVMRLRDRGFRLLDVQQSTHHLMSFGATELPRPAYLRRLKEALNTSCTFIDGPGR